MSGGKKSKVPQNVDPQTKDCEAGQHCVSYNYTGPVTTHIYTVHQSPTNNGTNFFPFPTSGDHVFTTPPESPSDTHHSKTHTVTLSPHTSSLHGSMQSSQRCESTLPIPAKHTVTDYSLTSSNTTVCQPRCQKCDNHITENSTMSGSSDYNPLNSTVRRRCKVTEESKTNPLSSTTDNVDGDILQDLGNRLFDDVFPYRQLQRYYHGNTKEAIRIVTILFLLYQGLAVMLMSICENGGLLAMFRTDEKNRYTAIVCRLIAFTLRFLVRVVTPLCFTLHIPTMASKPPIPKIGLTRAQALPQIFKVHRYYSSEEEVVELLKDNHEQVFKKSEEMTKRRIRSMWIPMVNAAFLVILLLYLGAFLICESNVMKGGVCNSLDRTIIWIPFINYQIHVIIVIESCSLFVITLITGIAANCYYHENTIAKYAVTIGGEAVSIHHSVRRRWAVLDWYCAIMPIVLALVTLLSMSTGQPFTPALTHELDVSELVDWYFWIVVLTVLQFLAFSCNRMMKNACVLGFLLSVVFVCMVEVDISTIPYGSLLVLLYCGLSAMCSNLLLSVCVCYFRHAVETGHQSSWLWFVCSMFSLGLLFFSLVVTVYREVAHIASFVHVL